MSVQRDELISILNNELASNSVKDYCPNGLQVEGKDKIHTIVTGVTASLALIKQAIAHNADAILVHHGYFWKGEAQSIVGMKKARIQALLQHDINLISYHLPLDIHPELGNNAQLGELLELSNVRASESILPQGIVMQGELTEGCSHQEFKNVLTNKLGRSITSVGQKSLIRRVAWCTGGGQHFIDEVAQFSNASDSIDAFISGEISEQTTHSAIEQNIDFFAVGHHASERYGVKKLGEYLANKYQLSVKFIDIDNPA